MELFILDMGAMLEQERDRDGNLVDIRCPVLGFLLKTEHGNILFDTGCEPMDESWSKLIRQNFPLEQAPEQSLTAQLALCGVTPAEIGTVVLSHCHFDHMGGIRQFPHAEVWVPKADYIDALVSVHTARTPDERGFYFKQDVTAPAARWHLVEEDEDFELVPGVEVVNLPGHTSGLLGLVVHLERDGVMILAQDAVTSAEKYGWEFSNALMTDLEKYTASMGKLHALAHKHNAFVVFAHDDAQFQTLRHVPESYS